MRRVVAGLGLFMALTVAPAVAAAGDIGCVWRAIPEGPRSAAIRAYVDGREDDVLQFIDDELFNDAVGKCVPEPKSERAAKKTYASVATALANYIVQLGSEAKLQKRLQIETTSLERAYGLLEPKRRRDLAQFAQDRKKPSNSAIAALGDAIVTAYPQADMQTLVDQPVFRDFVLYFGSRSLREQTEANF